MPCPATPADLVSEGEAVKSCVSNDFCTRTTGGSGLEVDCKVYHPDITTDEPTF